MLTDDEIKALLEGCEGVTPGPWTVEMHGPSPVLYSGRSNERHGLNLMRLSDGDWNFNNNAAHIARCDPSTIAELCTRLLSAEARVRVLEEALRECEETLALVEYPNVVDPRYGAEVEALGERIGYGALMSSASASWRENAGKLAGSEFVAGPCFVTVVRTLMIVRTALQEQSK
jgi:hypothetical protein